MPSTIRLIGAPTDIGAGCRGASLGPEALRVAGIATALRQQGRTVDDQGNLNGPLNPGLPPMDGYRHLTEATRWNQSVYTAVSTVLAQKELPILLGGDHSLSVGSISAVAMHCKTNNIPLRVLWLDAHADFNTATTTPSGNLHGMPVACLCGHGPAQLTELAGFKPILHTDEIRHIGVRSVDEEEKRWAQSQGLKIFDMRFIDEMGMRHTMEHALADLVPGTHLHLSFDIDFLDSDIAPGVSTPVRGGPTYREAQLCMEMIADTGHLASVDIMELNPAQDVRNCTAELVVDLLQSLFGKSTLMR